MHQRVLIIEEGTGGIIKADFDPLIVIPGFIKLMGEIGQYGLDKHKENSFQAMASRGEMKRTHRLSTAELRNHIKTHFAMYESGQEHDHFGTLKHQLGAVAFNAMMEYWFLCIEHPEEAESNG